MSALLWYCSCVVVEGSLFVFVCVLCLCFLCVRIVFKVCLLCSVIAIALLWVPCCLRLCVVVVLLVYILCLRCVCLSVLLICSLLFELSLFDVVCGVLALCFV